MNRKHIPYYLAGALALVTFVVYLTALRNGFVLWDDDLYIYENDHIRTLGSGFFRWALTDVTTIYWQPMTWFSHALDYALWGLDPRGHHLSSILIHAANTALVFLVITRLLGISAGNTARSGPSRSGGEPAGMIAAGVTAALFGLHPLHVESAAWVSERKDLLCALSSLLSMKAYLSFVKDRQDATGGTGTTAPYRSMYFLQSLGWFIIALSSKPMAVTLPIVLLIIDWYPFRRIGSLKSLWSACWEKLPFLAGSAAVSLITLSAQKTMQSVASLDMVPLSTRLLVACRALAAYLGKMVLPVDLLPLYAYPRTVSFLAPEYLVSVFVVAGITAAAVVTARRRPVGLALWGYYVITLAPTLGIVQAGSQAMADRFTYLPAIGPFLGAGLIAAALWNRVDAMERRGAVTRRILAGAGVVIGIALAVVTVRQIAVWRTSISLWTHVIEHQPLQVYFAYTNRGISFEDAGFADRALEDYTTAIMLNPGDARALAYRGGLFSRMGERERAIEDLTRAVAADPSSGDAYAARGFEYSQSGRFDEAIDDFDRAIELGSGGAEVYLNRGVVLDRTGRMDRAEADYGKAIALKPGLSVAYRNRGVLRRKLGRLGEAMDDYSRALALDPAFVTAYLDRGMLYLQQGSSVLGVADLQRACDLGSAQGCSAVRRYRERPEGADERRPSL